MIVAEASMTRPEMNPLHIHASISAVEDNCETSPVLMADFFFCRVTTCRPSQGRACAVLTLRLAYTCRWAAACTPWGVLKDPLPSSPRSFLWPPRSWHSSPSTDELDTCMNMNREPRVSDEYHRAADRAMFVPRPSHIASVYGHLLLLLFLWTRFTDCK